MNDLNRTLTALEGDDWGRPENESRLVSECHRLRHVPLRDLSIEDLRLLIGQEISLIHLVPLALDHLEQNPWSEGHLFPGDLLKNTVGIRKEFWVEQPTLMMRMQSVLDSAEERWRMYQKEIKPIWGRVFGG